MSLKSRVDRLASKANLNACPGCSFAVIHIYDSSDPRAFQTRPRQCSKCGRSLGTGDGDSFTFSFVDSIVVMIPDNHRGAA
jgi:hypothetical protein